MTSRSSKREREIPITHLELPGGLLDPLILSKVDAIAQQSNCVGCDGRGLSAAIAAKLPYGCSYKARVRVPGPWLVVSSCDIFA